MKIIVGLGNPGDEYRHSRHNIGFIMIDKFAQSRKMRFEKSGKSLLAKRNHIMIVKPQTYMNLSGRAIADCTEDIDEILIVCDDIYLPFGEIRIRNSGGDGGHNGLKSIIYELESEDFKRMRIGVGQPDHSGLLKEYVLEDFTENELVKLEKTADFTVKLIDCFIENGFQSMLNFYSKNKKSYSEQNASESMTKGGT